MNVQHGAIWAMRIAPARVRFGPRGAPEGRAPRTPQRTPQQRRAKAAAKGTGRDGSTAACARGEAGGGLHLYVLFFSRAHSSGPRLSSATCPLAPQPAMLPHDGST